MGVLNQCPCKEGMAEIAPQKISGDVFGCQTGSEDATDNLMDGSQGCC